MFSPLFMVTSITRFPLPAGINPEAYRKGLIAVAPQFQKPVGLLSKAFLVSEDGRQAGGVYLWSSKADAEAFEPGLRLMIRARFGVDPDITYFQTPVVVDNQRQRIDTATGPT